VADGFPYSVNINQPMPAGAQLVTDVGVFPAATTAGGNGTLTSLNVVANQQIGAANSVGVIPPLPAGAFIDSIALRETTGNGGVTVNIGSTLAGSDIVSGQAVSSGGGVLVVAPSKTSYAAAGANAAQNVYINSSSFGTSKINVCVNYIIPGI
jgi:hypothetical protein